MDLNVKKLFITTLQLVVALVLAMGCAKGQNEPRRFTDPEPGTRARAFTGQSGMSYLNFLEVGFNTPWKVNAILTFFDNNKGSVPSFADTPLSATSVRLYMGLAFTMATNGFNGDTANPKKVYAHLNLNVGPVIGSAVTNQSAGQVSAFLSHLCGRFWNRAPSAEELSDLNTLWNALATSATNSSVGTKDVAIRVAATIASSPQALMQIH
jgi:hypothetical protein